MSTKQLPRRTGTYHTSIQSTDTHSRQTERAEADRCEAQPTKKCVLLCHYRQIWSVREQQKEQNKSSSRCPDNGKKIISIHFDKFLHYRFVHLVLSIRHIFFWDYNCSQMFAAWNLFWKLLSTRFRTSGKNLTQTGTCTIHRSRLRGGYADTECV